LAHPRDIGDSAGNLGSPTLDRHEAPAPGAGAAPAPGIPRLIEVPRLTRTKVVIVGAGPYGLSIAAHLTARGVEHRIFGTPMAFWSKVAGAAPERFLKSFGNFTDISAPVPGAGFAAWCAARGFEPFEPCPMENFAAYGKWFQQTHVPHLEHYRVETIRRTEDGFEITLDSGESLRCESAIIATGLEYFEHLPEPLAALPPELVSHSHNIEDFARFAGLNVAVIGSGQSALEAAALVREAGGTPTLIVRDSAIHYSTRVPQHRNLWHQLRYPISGLGAGPKSWLLTTIPWVCRLMPERTRTNFVKTHLPPKGAWWLRHRVEPVIPALLNTTITNATPGGNQVTLHVQTGAATSERHFHRVIAATGFKPDIDRIAPLDDDLKRAITRLEGGPKLDNNFRSSIPGLYFVGPAAAMSFGPLYRFVAGAKFTAQKLSRHLQKAA
jgi:thioredoxin reductase